MGTEDVQHFYELLTAFFKIDLFKFLHGGSVQGLIVILLQYVLAFNTICGFLNLLGLV